VKRIETFSATECACERLFYQLCNSIGDFRHQVPDSLIVGLLVIKTRNTWPNVHTSKNALVFSEGPMKCNQMNVRSKRRPNDMNQGKRLLFQSPPITSHTMMKATTMVLMMN
jgi:hypothetical protein